MEMNRTSGIPAKFFSGWICLILLGALWTTLGRCQDRATVQRIQQAETQEAYLYPFRSPATGRVGYIDAHGKIKIPPQFMDCNAVNAGREFYGGYVLVGCTPVSYADQSGRQWMAGQFDDAQPFSHSMAAIKSANGSWGYIRSDGTTAVTPKFTDAGSFAEGLAPVSNEDGAWGYIDDKGREKIPFSFQRAGIFSNGLAMVQADGKFGYIEKSGRFAVEAQFKDARPFSEGLAAVLTDFWSYIGLDGKSPFPGDYEQAGEFAEGLAPVKPKSSQSFGYINRSGVLIIHPQFEAAYSFRNGLALVYFRTDHMPGSEEKRILHYGYINKNGQIIFSSELSYVQRKDGSRGSDEIRFIPMTKVNIKSSPTGGAKVYLVPLDDWESQKNLTHDKEKMLQYLLNSPTPLKEYEVIDQVYRALIELNGKQVTRQFDVNQYSSPNLVIDFDKE